jgi:RNA recognition motif-containing protein
VEVLFLSLVLLGIFSWEREVKPKEGRRKEERERERERETGGGVMDSDQGKLFIGGISWETTEEKLRDHFQAYGEVAEVVIMKDRATGRARGFGFVVFADPAVADRVVKEKHTIDGRTVSDLLQETLVLKSVERETDIDRGMLVCGVVVAYVWRVVKGGEKKRSDGRRKQVITSVAVSFFFKLFRWKRKKPCPGMRSRMCLGAATVAKCQRHPTLGQRRYLWEA